MLKIHDLRYIMAATIGAIDDAGNQDRSDQEQARMTGDQDTVEADESWQLRAEMALAAAAAADRLITYAELADAAGISGRHRINRLTSWLEARLETEVGSGGPMLSARVISRSRGGLPAPGFFMKCGELGIYDGPPDGPKAYAFHLNCLR
jgi:hypothetical protein